MNVFLFFLSEAALFFKSFLCFPAARWHHRRAPPPPRKAAVWVPTAKRASRSPSAIWRGNTRRREPSSLGSLSQETGESRNVDHPIRLNVFLFQNKQLFYVCIYSGRFRSHVLRVVLLMEASSIFLCLLGIILLFFSLQGGGGGCVHKDHGWRDVEGRAGGEGDPIQRPHSHPASGQPRVLPWRLRGGQTAWELLRHDCLSVVAGFCSSGKRDFRDLEEVSRRTFCGPVASANRIL